MKHLSNLPTYVSVAFIMITAATLIYLFLIIRQSISHKKYAIHFLVGSIILLTVQAVLAYQDFFYNSLSSLPPKFPLIFLPSLIFIIVLSLSKKGKVFLDSLSSKQLTLLHSIRIPVEIVLFWLFIGGAVPELMTFEGRNFDILAGITAPFIFWLGYHKKILSRNILIAWNIICALLLANIVISAVLSIPFPLQQLAFDQPNYAVILFPFVWLPGFVVPAVIFSHVVSLRHLFINKTAKIS